MHRVSKRFVSRHFLGANRFPPSGQLCSQLLHFIRPFRCEVPSLGRIGCEVIEFEDVELAEKAVRQFLESTNVNSSPLIAASIGPYGAYLADGSEYRGDYNVSTKVLTEFHQSRIEILDRTNADFFACETIPSMQEVQVLKGLLSETRKMGWISFSCKDGKHLNDGTPIAEAAELLKDEPNILAIGVNCTSPEYISDLIRNIKPHSGDKKIVVYPNSGEAYDAESKTWSASSGSLIFEKINKEWISLGADIIGGCCRIGSNEISALNTILYSG